ncbi:MAG: hypothetical protein VW405_12815 [Rhodospirillaceae bacterium]
MSKVTCRLCLRMFRGDGIYCSIACEERATVPKDNDLLRTAGATKLAVSREARGVTPVMEVLRPGTKNAPPQTRVTCKPTAVLWRTSAGSQAHAYNGGLAIVALCGYSPRGVLREPRDGAKRCAYCERIVATAVEVKA